jgi:hypothetical protein
VRCTDYEVSVSIAVDIVARDSPARLVTRVLTHQRQVRILRRDVRLVDWPVKQIRRTSPVLPGSTHQDIVDTVTVYVADGGDRPAESITLHLTAELCLAVVQLD